MYFTTSVDVSDYLFNEYRYIQYCTYIMNEFMKNKFVFYIPELPD